LQLAAQERTEAPTNTRHASKAQRRQQLLTGSHPSPPHTCLLLRRPLLTQSTCTNQTFQGKMDPWIDVLEQHGILHEYMPVPLLSQPHRLRVWYLQPRRLRLPQSPLSTPALQNGNQNTAVSLPPCK